MKKWIGMLLVAVLLVLAGCGAKQRDGAVNRDVETEQIESICGKAAAQAILPGV